LKIAIYYNHYNTLGHSTRIFALIKGIKRAFPRCRIVLFEGGRTASLLPLQKYAKVYTLPYSIDKKGFFIEERRAFYKKMVASGTMDKMLKERLGMMRSVLRDFKPDIFMTEYFPFGQEFWTFEMPILLREIKSTTHCKIVGSCGYLSYIDKSYEYIQEFYDQLFVHSPRDFALKPVARFPENMASGLRRVLADFKDRIQFTGFVLDEPRVVGIKEFKARCLRGKFSRMVFVSRGGGIVNKEILLSALFLARKRKDELFFVCCGPATSKAEMKEYDKIARGQKNVKLAHAMEPDLFNQYFAAADVCVNMSGYNTSLKLMYFQKRAVVVPFYTTEQRWRADLLTHYLPVVILPEQEMTVGRLDQALEAALQVPVPKSAVPKSWFKGVDETTRSLKCLL
jgi:predicted glycosyltransferase